MQDSRATSKFIVGLTGGIGSGKTTVSDLFNSLGVNVIDADVISRSLVHPDSPCYQEIIAHFGKAILDSKGDLDRSRLRALVFNDARERHWLEQLLHPLIRKQIDTQITASNSDYVLLVVPLLLESQDYGFVDRILVVDVPESVQVERIMSRDNGEEALIRKIIAAQLPREERVRQADDIIDNTHSEAALKEQVENLHKHYLKCLNQ